MALLARMYHTSRWTQVNDNILDILDLDADSVSDLSVKDHTISTWIVNDGDKQDIDKVVVALASCFKTMDSISLVLLDFDELKKKSFEIKETVSKGTKIESYANLHRDIVVNKSRELLELSKIVLKQIVLKKTVRYNTDMITKMMLCLMKSRKMEFNVLNDRFKDDLAKRVDTLIQKRIIDESIVDGDVLDYINDKQSKEGPVNSSRLYLKRNSTKKCV